MSVNVFQKRRQLLESRGFSSYEEYLASTVWRKIRTFVYRRDQHRCRMCGKKGLLRAHHLTYDEATLFTAPAGEAARKKLKDVVSLCDACHESVHRDEMGEFTHLGVDLRQFLLPVPGAGKEKTKKKTRGKRKKNRKKKR